MKRTDITALFPDATDEQINKLMNLNGEDINRAKGDLASLQGQLTEAQTALQRMQDESANAADLEKTVTNLQNELNGMKRAEAVRALREKVSAEKKVPTTLLTGDTEEACAAQADAILAFAKESGYPAVPDAGEVHGAENAGKDASWRSLASQLPKK